MLYYQYHIDIHGKWPYVAYVIGGQMHLSSLAESNFPTKAGVRNRHSTRHSTASIAHDESGTPFTSAKDRKTLLGKSPSPHTDKRYLDQERLITQAEILMLRGHSSYSTIAKQLGISGVTAKQYMKRVLVRWEVHGGRANHRKMRGEALARLRLIEKELWGIVKTSPPQVTLSALQQIVDVIAQQLILNGLTQSVLEDMATAKLPTPPPVEKVKMTPEILKILKNGLVKLQAMQEQEMLEI